MCINLIREETAKVVERLPYRLKTRAFIGALYYTVYTVYRIQVAAFKQLYKPRFADLVYTL